MTKPTRSELHESLRKAVVVNNVEQVQTILAQEKYLVNRLVHGDQMHCSFLYMAAEAGRVEMAKVLIEAKANVNQQCVGGETPLIAAATSGRDKLVALLLQQPEIIVDLPDDDRNTPLMAAANEGHTSIVQQLLDANASVNSVDDNGYTGLVFAASSNHNSTCRLLLQYKADVNRQDNDGGCALRWAAKYGNEVLATALLAAKAIVDMPDRCGCTPLMEAASVGSLSTVKLCLAAGADVQLCTKELNTALHSAAENGNVAVVDELLLARADPNARNCSGCTPLIDACDSGNTDCIPSLLEASADINTVDNEGDTPLMCAIMESHAATSKFLLDNGADWLIKGEQSARQWARGEGAEIESLFECTTCGWEGMCCSACRKKYCVIECDKFSDSANKDLPSTVDCRLHQKIAHQSVLEWALAMSSLQLPPYVLEHVFNCLDFEYKPREGDYQQQIGEQRISIADIAHPPLHINENFIHLLVEERTHQENIKLFIAVHQAYRKKLSASNIKVCGE